MSDKPESAAGISSPPLAGSAFPRNPERDERGRAVLYPGRVRYEGYAALFEIGLGGEFVVLAPDMETLNAVVMAHQIRNEGDPVDVDRCVHVRMERMPNVANDTAQTRA